MSASRTVFVANLSLMLCAMIVWYFVSSHHSTIVYKCDENQLNQANVNMYYQALKFNDYAINCYVLHNVKRNSVLYDGCSNILVAGLVSRSLLCFITLYCLASAGHRIYIDGNELTRKRSCRTYSAYCYKNDYVTVLEYFRQMRRPSVLLLEDDVLLCLEAVGALKDCYRRGLSCKLGDGATANYFHSLDTFAVNETAFESVDHVDLYLRRVHAFERSLRNVTHLRSRSTMSGADSPLIHRCDHITKLVF